VSEEKTPEIYYAAAQDAGIYGDMDIEVRARGDAESLVPVMRNIVAGLNPDVPLVRPMTQRAQFDDSYREQRMFAIMGGFFGLLAGILVAVGLYGMHSFHVSRRTAEIGVRMAFGASHGNVLAMVLKENVRVLALGLAIGTPLTFLVARLLKSMLYKVSPFDWISFVVAAAAICVVSIGAAIGPARRAASVVPMQALRVE
jgi:ABC-type antimicrobial peptide transport system permease subunit